MTPEQKKTGTVRVDRNDAQVAARKAAAEAKRERKGRLLKLPLSYLEATQDNWSNIL